MAIENATYVSTLNPTLPNVNDLFSEGAAHIQQVKTVMQATFPNATAPILIKPGDEMSLTFVGMIVPFGLPVSFIPSNWRLCDGSTVTINGQSFVLPDFRDRALIGAGPTYPVGTTMGTTQQTPTITVSNTTLTIDQIPNHNHVLSDPGHLHTTTKTNSNSMAGGDFTVATPGGAANTGTSKTGITIAPVGGGLPHGHTATASTISTIQPGLSINFIMRVA